MMPMRSALAFALLGLLCISDAAVTTSAFRMTAEEARARRLQPAGEWLTYDPAREPGSALVDPHPAFSRDLGKARRLYHTDWEFVEGTRGPAAGPDLDATTCGSCHVETSASTMLSTPIRIARPTWQKDRLTFGDQITTRSIGNVRPEGQVSVDILAHTFRYNDGTTRQLTKPVATATMRDGSVIPVTLRVAPLLFGWGLLESVDPNMLGHFHDPDDSNGDGISGINRHDTGQLHGVSAALGWKANHRLLQHQVSAALENDMGIMSEAASPMEISPDEITAITEYVRSLGAPNRRKGATDRGQDLFGLTGCSGCHITAMLTRDDAEVEFAGQLIWPYSDFMLHDMGAGLADAGDAPDAAEWRTAPLWGVGYAETHLPRRGFLHDGRAANIEEAVLWHGGEAATSVEAFSALSAKDRALLLGYVRAL